MLGAIAGDIIGSVYEFTKQKQYDFEMLPKGSRFTDDTVMTVAVAHWLSHCDEEGNADHSKDHLVKCMQTLGHKYPFAGYGSSFNVWLWCDIPQPYNSWGNGRQCGSVRSDFMPRLLTKLLNWRKYQLKCRIIIPKASKERKL